MTENLDKSSESITMLEAFDVMHIFLENVLSRQKGSEYIDGIYLVSGMDRTMRPDSGPADPAFWYDWMDAVSEAKSHG